MTDPAPVHPPQIDCQLERALSDANEVELPLVREVLYEPSDRWYGQLVVTTYVSLAETRDPETALPAAAGIELLRGYVRLRSRLLVTLAGNGAHSRTLDPTPALLAGDYLYTAAFSSLRSVPDTTSSECFDILTSVVEAITEGFARTYTPAGSADHNPTEFFDKTAGSLGEGAAILGETLAGIDESKRQHFEQLGRGLSTARQIDRVLDAEPSEALVVPSTLDESRFRAHAERQRDEANRTLDELSETTDVTRLRAFAETEADASKEE